MSVDTTGAAYFGPGLYVKAGAILNTTMEVFALELARRAGMDIVVTSGVRTPLAQAQALAQDMRFDVYQQRDLVDEILGGDTSVAGMAATIQAQVDRGRYLSRHLRGDAIDLRVHGLLQAERDRLKQIARELGGNVVDEGDHIHVGGLGTSAPERIVQAVAAAPQQAARAVMAVTPRWLWPVAGGMFGLSFLLGLFSLIRLAVRRRP